MSIIKLFIEYVLHLDKYLALIVQQFGTLVYLLLFIIIFLETGFVIAPFLPGDSLIFATGTLAAVNVLNIWILFILLSVAAVLGDTVNYWIGSYFGAKAFKKYPKIFKKMYLDKTKRFFAKYGNKTIVLARFVPIVRTFAPFFAGVGKMPYGKFIQYNIVGGIVWVGLFLFTGYFFGNIPFVKNHFSLVIIFVIVVSFIPVIIEYVKYRHQESA
ncbi:DedA family protein [Candidatus Woesearchaeota archaeon]|nr:MAG: DedA family protein [Candidatus Woesearchaeota archaeon]